jgi:5-methylcytosine-specific restriction endonuclease McrA
MPYKDPDARRARQALYRAANREKIRAKQRERHEKVREKKIAYKRAWYAANRERELEKQRLVNAANPQANVARAKAWRAANPERAAEIQRRHRISGRDKATADYCATILYYDPCVYCGGPGGCVDHIEPRANGGQDHWTNLTSSCRPCNSRKNAKPLLVFLASAVSL